MIRFVEEVNDERSLIADCKKIYEQLEDIYYGASDIGYTNAVKEMFKLVGGNVTVKANRTSSDKEYMSYNGAVNKPFVMDGREEKRYTIGGSILDNSRGDWYRLIEDLSLAYYRTNGGINCGNVWQFKDALGIN